MAKTPSTTAPVTRGTELRQRREGGVIPIQSKSEVAAVDEDLALIRKGEFTSEQIKDPFSSTAGLDSGTSLSDIKPPFNFAALLRMAMDNSTLKQCIEAMVTNISGHGYRLEFIGPEGQAESTEAEKEAKGINSFMAHPNDDHSMMELRKRVRWDLEALGNAYIEVGRNRKNEVTACWHIPGHLMRLTETDKKATPVNMKLPRFDGLEERKVDKYFRRYVQIKGAKRVYFKEYGDPRAIDPATGQEKPGMSFEDTATEIIHLKLYHAGYAYGLPRWINNAVAIKGSRQAELTNLDFFSENAVPAMVLLVSGGMVSNTTLTAIESHFTALKGRASMNRVMVVEAFGDEQAASEDGSIPPPKIELKAVGADRPKDGMFLEYDKAQTDKVRSSFRLPPIFLGLSQDYTHATANTSYDVAEGQVFGPERVGEDDIINSKILGGYDLQYWEVRSNPPRITDPAEVLDAIEQFDSVGAMTPNVAIGIANEMFDLDIELIEGIWGNLPFAVVEKLVEQGKLVVQKDGTMEVSEGDAAKAAAAVAAAAAEANKKPDDEKTPVDDKAQQITGAEGNDPVEGDDAKKARVRRALADLRSAIVPDVPLNDDPVANIRSRTRVSSAA